MIINNLIPISGWFWTDPDPGEVLLEQVPDESGFTRGILTNQHHHRPKRKNSVIEWHMYCK